MNGRLKHGVSLLPAEAVILSALGFVFVEIVHACAVATYNAILLDAAIKREGRHGADTTLVVLLALFSSLRLLLF